MEIIDHIAQEIAVRPQQVTAAVALLDGGATVPFIARYRKEATGGLDDTQLRHLQERLLYLRELDARRQVILASLREQEKLTPELEQAINAAVTKTVLEDLYLPYKPKRRTKAQIAREAGLEPLADTLCLDLQCVPLELATNYLAPDHGILDAAAALESARHIVMERLAEDAALLENLREALWRQAILRATVADGKEQDGAKFRDYFDYQEALAQIPSHRALALLRGRNEGILQFELLPGTEETAHSRYQTEVVRHLQPKALQTDTPAAAWLIETARLAWKIKLFTRLELDLLQRLREAAEQEAIAVFARNLRDLLLAAPAGPKATMGLDPGLRAGVKVAVVDATGKCLETATIYPHAPQKRWDEAIATLAVLIERHHVQLVSIGNGTGSRETEQLVADLAKRHSQLSFTQVIVSEAGASVYSASALAAQEFPDLDVSLRGAVSIARRLQDPLAELVKIDPKSIGVGQYQHDVNAAHLARALDAVVEDCVNAVGVDVNTASVSLLKRVAGLTASVSQNIVEFRNSHGPFRNRQQLKQVPRLGEKAFEQAAGFLRIMHGDNPLDASAVHPEAYPVVKAILHDCGKTVHELIGQSEFLRTLDPANYTDEHFGLPTVTDILRELEKPGRDPRPTFRSVQFKVDIKQISDLQPGIWLEGVVTNVANFGAFVDIGVHQDGLVHVSHLADHFVQDPRSVVKTGDIVRVKVLEVDVARGRISLSMRADAATTPTSSVKNCPPPRNHDDVRRGKRPRSPATQPTTGALAQALRNALKN